MGSVSRLNERGDCRRVRICCRSEGGAGTGFSPVGRDHVGPKWNGLWLPGLVGLGHGLRPSVDRCEKGRIFVAHFDLLLVTCVYEKADGPRAAKDLYRSAYFGRLRRYAEAQ